MPSEISYLVLTTLKSAAPAPATPVILSRTEMSVTVKTEPGQEYALLLNNLP